ncbi:TolB family protein [Dactylosporangium sp. McL0621]|uniref:TolB family protein n=1 Tax=Dactylosporangium sp. McL0621 TaxID=3415678 RepID=UPI003CE6DCAE
MDPSREASKAAPQELTGTLYFSGGDDLYRLNKSTPKKIAGVHAYTANVSPDDTRIAFIEGTDVVVADRDGQHRQTVLTGTPDIGWEPAWSGDSQRLLVAKVTADSTTIGVVTVATKAFAPLARQSGEGIHPLWSGDGKKIAYGTGDCRLGIMNADGSGAKVIPNVGDRHNCDPYSVNRDGTLVAVDQRVGDEPWGDIGRDSSANAVVDTRTGQNVSLPVTGTISAIVFLPTGEILVRTAGRLTLLDADRTVRTQITEPAAVKSYRLISYVPTEH